jgi:hypothetical protein
MIVFSRKLKLANMIPIRKCCSKIVVALLLLGVLYILTFGGYLKFYNVSASFKFGKTLNIVDCVVYNRYGGYLTSSYSQICFMRTNSQIDISIPAKRNFIYFNTEQYGINEMHNPERFARRLHDFYPDFGFHNYSHCYYLTKEYDVVGELFMSSEGYIVVKIY